MTAFVSKEALIYLRDYQAVVSENQRLELAYQQEGHLMENFRNQASNWPRMVSERLLRTRCRNYLIHAFNNF